jgi:phage terminase small subunit
MAENDQDQQLNAKQEAFLTAYLASSNITIAAKTSGMADKTARRLVKQPAFQAAYHQAKRELFNQALDGLREHVDKAIKTLARHMDAEETPPGAQIRAAQIYLEQAIQVHKMSELEEKYAELEQLVKAQGR